MSFLDNLLANFKKGALALDDSSQSVLGIDIGASSIKVVQIRKDKGKALLETYGQIYLAPYAKKEAGRVANLDDELIAQALLDLIKEANITSLDAGVSIPFTSAFSKVIKVPKVSNSQLAKVIPIEARKYVPMPLNEVSLNWVVIPEQNTYNFLFNKEQEESVDENRQKIDFTEVLLVAVHKDSISKTQSVIQKAGINASFYELGAFSAIRSILDFDILPNMLVDIAATNTKIYVVESGILRFSYLINFGSQHVTENISRALSVPFEKAERIKKEQGWIALDNQTLVNTGSDIQKTNLAIESVLNRVFSEMNRVIINYEKRYGRTIKKIHFFGGGSNMPGFLDFANKKLSIDAVLADSFNKIVAPAFLEPVLKDIGTDFAISNGLALRKISG